MQQYSSQRTVKAISGLNKVEYEALVKSFHTAWIAAESRRPTLRTGTERRRALGAGRCATLRTSRDKLLFILLWFKVYPTFDAMAFFFGMSQPQACVWAHRLFPILEAALKTKLALPERKAYTLEKTLAEFPSLTFIVDGTERPVRRPKHGIRRKALYSGHKKRHAVKNISAVRASRVVLLGKTRPGSWHDKKCIDRERWTFPHGSNVLADSGFEGYTQPDSTVLLPKRKPHRRKPPKRDKMFNRRLAKRRIVVEHAIAGIKRSRICSDILRTKKPDLPDKIMLIGCALHNFRVDSRTAA